MKEMPLSRKEATPFLSQGDNILATCTLQIKPETSVNKYIVKTNTLNSRENISIDTRFVSITKGANK